MNKPKNECYLQVVSVNTMHIQMIETFESFWNTVEVRHINNCWFQLHGTNNAQPLMS